MIGAEEYSAMQAAEGEVQEKGYVASFPSLINASGEATYIMVLKDNAGLVKLYALVNVENYSIVATGTSQAEAKEKYIELLKSEGIVKDEEPAPVVPDNTKDIDVTVADIRTVTINGDTVMYITDENGVLYKKAISADEALMLIKTGDKITVKYTDTDVNEKIKSIVSWAYTPDPVQNGEG